MGQLFHPIPPSFNGCHSDGHQLQAEWDPDIADRVARLEAPEAPDIEMAELENPNCLDTMGWGLVLPEEKPGEKPEEVQCPHLWKIWDHRGRQAVFRFRRGASKNGVYLRRYEADGRWCDLSFTADFGSSRPRMPFYLLLAGSPAEIPWEVQFAGAANRAVGRLDLDETGRANYANALVNNWSDSAAQPGQVLTWSVNKDDITEQMKKTVGDRFAKRVREDPLFTGTYLHTDDATIGNLETQLRQLRPELLVTTSHGCTDGNNLRDQLGLPHGQQGTQLAIGSGTDLFDGVLWYCLACGSAGGEGTNPYVQILSKTCAAGEAFERVANLGAMTSSLSRAILGSAKPARAFVGHVGPTFEVTLKDFRNNLPLTNGIVDSLHGRYCLRNDQRWRLGRCFDPWRVKRCQMQEEYLGIRTEFNKRYDGSASWLLDIKLRSMDARRLVLLGDPALVRPCLPEPSRCDDLS